MDRREFLTFTASATFARRRSDAPAAANGDLGLGTDPNLRLVERVERVDEVFIERRPSRDGRWVLTFVDWRTTPETDREILIECSYQNAGVHIDDDVGHETTFWAPSRGGTSLMITFASTAHVRIFRHVDRGRDVVLEAKRAT